MAVITISITESPIQIVAGIPKNIILETNIPATIFYTLDDTEPTLNSNIAIGAIDLPTNNNTVILKMFATNGVDSSPIIESSFGPNFTDDLRRPRDKVIQLCPNNLDNRAFSTSTSDPHVRYGNTAGLVVDDPSKEQIPDGYDGTATGTPSTYTNKPYNRTNYDIVYSETNNIGESGRGIGTLPAHVTIEQRVAPPLMSDANSRLFDPKALVIVQDGREKAEIIEPLLNRQFFSLGDDEKIRDGAKYQLTGYEGNSPTGSLLRPIYNKKEDTYRFYSRDSETNRWIVSIEPNRHAQQIKKEVLLPNQSFGQKKVFKWFPFKRSTLC